MAQRAPRYALGMYTLAPIWRHAPAAQGVAIIFYHPPSLVRFFDGVEDGVKDLTQGVYSGPSRSFGSREMILEMCPLGVGKVG